MSASGALRDDPVDPREAVANPAETPVSHVSTKFYALASVGLAAVAFGFEWLGRLAERRQPSWVDAATLDWVVSHRAGWPGLTAFFEAVTRFGNPWGGTIATVTVAVMLVALERAGVGQVRRSEVFVWLGSLLGGRLLSTALKGAYQRPRPPELLRLVVETSYSFPSGHSLFASIYFATLAIIVVRHLRDRRPAARWAVVGSCALAACTVAASRVWLAAHYLTDVTGGLLVGTAWVLLVAVVRRAVVDYRKRGRAVEPSGRV